MWRCLKKKVEKWKQQCVDSVASRDSSLQTDRGRRRLQMSCQPELSWRPPVAGLCHSETANKWSQSHGMRLTSNRVVFRWDSTPPELRVLVCPCGHAGRQKTRFVSRRQSSEEVRGPKLTQIYDVLHFTGEKPKVNRIFCCCSEAIRARWPFGCYSYYNYPPVSVPFHIK